MRWAVKIFTVFGIPVYVHLTFLILPLLFYSSAGFKGVFLVFAVFACVAAHELCHSLAAKRFGVVVKGITLFPIGGVASLGSYPRKPTQELVIALAGPSFNVIFAIVCFYPLYKILSPGVLFRPSLNTWPSTIAYAFWINPWLAAFNLLPAFPMDGGRILRSFLARRMSLRRATRIAAGIGHFFALLFAFIGIRNGYLMLVVIAVFIYMAASFEEFEVEMMETIKERYHEQDTGSP